MDGHDPFMAGTRPLAALEELIGHRFSDPMLLECALRHRSWVKDGSLAAEEAEDNERLEFLGDAVLGLVVTERLYRSSRSAEGRLTRARAPSVNGVGPPCGASAWVCRDSRCRCAGFAAPRGARR